MNEKIYNVYRLFAPLWSDMYDDSTSFAPNRPLLAHYCSLPVLESIVKNNEIWFSNPLLMNDWDELRFGLLQSRERFRQNNKISAVFENPDRYRLFARFVENGFDRFEQGQVLDIYVVCFSEHAPSDADGLLSMWRGYGANGGGAAIVLNSSRLAETENSPIQLARVRYGSTAERISWIDQLFDEFALILSKQIFDDEQLKFAAQFLCERMLTFALFTKHHGFREEREWRAVYLRHHDHKNLLVDKLSYFVTPNGVHPKLKLKFERIDGVLDGTATLEELVESIILGPSAGSALSRMAICRMLEAHGRHSLAQRISASSTPFRA